MARTTIAMVVAFLALGVGVYVLQTTRPAPAEGAQVYVLEIPEGDVTRIDVATPAGSNSWERQEPFGWKFVPSGAQADFSRVSSVVNRVSKLRSQAKVLDQVTDRSPYKLDQPTARVALTMKDGTVHTVLFGAQTVNNAAYYAMVEEKGALHTVSTLIVTDTEKLITEPPVPTPSASATPGASPTPTPDGTAVPTSTVTPTVGLPVPSVP